MECVTLLGAESVERAASRMQEAASEIASAVANAENEAHRQRVFMTEWLDRFEDIVSRIPGSKPAGGE